MSHIELREPHSVDVNNFIFSFPPVNRACLTSSRLFPLLHGACFAYPSSPLPAAYICPRPAYLEVDGHRHSILLDDPIGRAGILDPRPTISREDHGELVGVKERAHRLTERCVNAEVPSRD